MTLNKKLSHHSLTSIRLSFRIHNQTQKTKDKLNKELMNRLIKIKDNSHKLNKVRKMMQVQILNFKTIF